MRNPTPSSGQNSQLVHWWVLVHAGPTTWVWDCLDLWCVSYWLLNHFLNIKLNKIETENFTGIWGHSWCCWKALGWVRFNRVHFTIFRAKVWKILLFEWILLLEIHKNYKNWVWKEKSVEPSICSHLGQ